MREGYIDTKIGILPKDWIVIKQIEVATFFNGRAYKLEEWETNGTPVIRLQNLTGTGKEYYYSNLTLPEHQYCYQGDLLYMWSATFGPVWWFGDKAIYHYHIWKIEHDVKRLNPVFHYYLLNDITIRMKNESHGSTMLHVTKGGMEKLLIQLPPLPEQQKIAEILSTVDDKIDVIDQQISETQALKKGLMQRLLTKGIGHTEFKDSPLGEIPQSWEVAKLNEISNVVRGGSPRPAGSHLLFNGDYLPWITVAELTNSADKYITKTKTKLTELGSTQTRILEMDTVVLANSGATLGVPRILKIRGGANDGIAAFLTLTKVSNDYLYFFLQTLTKFFREQLAPGSGQPNLNTSLIGGVYISIPPLEEQSMITEILNVIDDKISVLSIKKVSYQELKQGLMQQLLTGKIRVNGLINKPTMA